MIIKKLPFNEVKSGMINARNLFNELDQLIVSKDTVLTDEILINLTKYNFTDISIKFPELEPVITTTFSERVQNSNEFKQFKDKYNNGYTQYKKYLDTFVSEAETPDIRTLLPISYDIISNSRNYIHFFDILSNMHDTSDVVYRHSMNVSMISMLFGKWLELSDDDVGILSVCGALHDVGKLLIDPSVLNKVGQYTSDEFNQMKKHTTLGFELLKSKGFDSKVCLCALNHHERCDGSGYPRGLKDSEIDLFSKIIAIADVYDSMTSKRAYKESLSPFDVIESFETEGLFKYDTKLIYKFLDKIASSFSNTTVLLSNGSTAKIILMNHNWLSHPIVQTNSGDFIDLSTNTNVKIVSLI